MRSVPLLPERSTPYLAGIIAYPAGHSVSPALQQAAFDYHGLPVRYEAWETAPAALAARVAHLRRPEVVGANVTVPHKQAVMALLDRIDEAALRVGAVNTIANRDGRLLGYNTDVAGFLRALRADLACEPRGQVVLLLGAGGAARAVAYALLREGARRLLIANRSRPRAVALASDLAEAAQDAALAVCEWEAAALAEATGAADLVVNATTLGMQGAVAESPLPADCFRPGMAAFDLVYNPPETPFLREARRGGARALGGLPMLVYQGADSFRLWTGREAPVAVMRAAAAAALGRQGEGHRA